jgi:MFS family permease
MSSSRASRSAGQIGIAAAIDVAGACTGALFFGQLTDRFGRKKLFIATLAVYLVGATATAFSFDAWYFYLFRFITGAGIGGEYAAINSAIDELIPARVRGRVDLIINGSFWLGAAAGSALALVFLDTDVFARDVGWRLAFGLGAVLGFVILLVRRHVPESPRWLFIHGQQDEAERVVGGIEEEVERETGETLPKPGQSLTIRQRRAIPFREIAGGAFKLYPRRAVLGFSLFVGQAFLYNGITFNLGTLLSTFFGVASATVPIFLVVYALSNFLGPLTLGRLFDTVGRKPMIAGCYLGSAAITVALAVLFVTEVIDSPWFFIAFIMLTFFFASAGASAAYLTVSEIFPMETRALAIAFFYAIGTAVGGITGPLLFGQLVGTDERGPVAIAFLIGAVVMAMGGVVELLFAASADRLTRTRPTRRRGAPFPSRTRPRRAGVRRLSSRRPCRAPGPRSCLRSPRPGPHPAIRGAPTRTPRRERPRSARGRWWSRRCRRRRGGDGRLDRSDRSPRRYGSGTGRGAAQRSPGSWRA